MAAEFESKRPDNPQFTNGHIIRDGHPLSPEQTNGIGGVPTRPEAAEHEPVPAQPESDEPPQRVQVVFNTRSTNGQEDPRGKVTDHPQVRALLARHQTVADVAAHLPKDEAAAAVDSNKEYRIRMRAAADLIKGKIPGDGTIVPFNGESPVLPASDTAGTLFEPKALPRRE